MNHADQSTQASAAASTIDELLEVDSSTITTIIDAGVHFEGKLTVAAGKTVLISGKFTGQIESEGAVIINGGAEVIGGIKARSVQVAGTVRRGKETDLLDVEGVLVLAKGAKVQCDAVYDGLKADYGVHISGSIRPRDMEQEAAVVETPHHQRPEGQVIQLGHHSAAN
jgi:cytoskeletal protein CcmA (bactofilin family)